MTETTAHVAGRKLDTSAGIPDDLARRMFDKLGSEYVGIVYLKSHTRAEDDDDKHRVTLAITNLEVAIEPDVAEALREIARSLYRGRVPTQLDLDSTLDDVEPDSDEYIRRAKSLVQCETCLHAKADQRISHAPDPDADSAFCTWETTGTEVLVDEERPPAADNAVEDCDLVRFMDDGPNLHCILPVHPDTDPHQDADGNTWIGDDGTITWADRLQLDEAGQADYDKRVAAQTSDDPDRTKDLTGEEVLTNA